jgi:hypothetical protein
MPAPGAELDTGGAAGSTRWPKLDADPHPQTTAATVSAAPAHHADGPEACGRRRALPAQSSRTLRPITQRLRPDGSGASRSAAIPVPGQAVPGRRSGPVRPLPPPGPRIGAPRFELGTSPTRTVRATRLRHAPKRPDYRTGGVPARPLAARASRRAQ